MGKEMLQKFLAERFIEVCSDIEEIVATGRYPVAVLLRGYGLLEIVQDFFAERRSDGKCSAEMCSEGMSLAGDGRLPEVLEEALSGYKSVYERCGDRLEDMLDNDVISQQAAAYLQSWKEKYEKAHGEYMKAVELWEAAKAAHKAQEEGSFFEKQRTLRYVRRLAGFKLERRRTGNFVARTFELMHQAQFAAREAELMMYEHNVEYKCNPEVYRKIYELACSR